jgi:hypothetical protein
MTNPHESAELTMGLSPRALDGEPSAWLAPLTRLLDEQRTLCAGLEALSAQQTGVLASGDTDALLRILGQRQTIVDRVTAINRALEPFRSRKEELLARLAPAQREGVVGRVAAIAGHVEAVRVRDEQDRRTIEGMRDGVAAELGGLTRGRGAAAAYTAGAVGGRGVGGPKFQDRQG